jgi:4-methyl-5(b-hydroxyethyl)-thiazole monophosphate biosynthesis
LVVDGFEEIEAVTPVDLLRRAGVEVVISGLHGIQVTGRCGIRLTADCLLEETAGDFFDLLMIPGGPGVTALRADGRAAGLADKFHHAGKAVAAICAAPVILKDAGLLEGRRFTCHIAVRDELTDAVDDRVVMDGGIITSRGAGTALDFGLAMVTLLCGEETAKEVEISVMA